MKKLYMGIIGFLVIAYIGGCSSSTDPQYSIRNDDKETVNIKVRVPGAEIDSLYVVDAGKTIEYQTIPEGVMTVTSVGQNQSISFSAVKYARYTIIISADKPPEAHVDL